MTSIDRASLEASPYRLTSDDIDALVEFAADCARLLGTSALSLDGDPDAPVLSVRFRDERQRPGVVYSYEWRLWDVDNDEDIDVYPLGALLVDYLGSTMTRDLQGTPGLPMWDPDDVGIVHVDVRSDRYSAWPQEWRSLGRPYRDQSAQLRYGDR